VGSEATSSCCDADGDRGSRQDHISGVARLASQHLIKSRYIAGLQCLRRLWLLVHEPQSYEEPAPGSPMDIGQEIGRKAHLLFPGGALVDEEPWQHAATRCKVSSSLLALFRVQHVLQRLANLEASVLRSSD